MAIDGKSVRGAAAGGNPRPHLPSAATHDGAIVIAQRQIPDKGSEIGELAALVAELDLNGTVSPSMRYADIGITHLMPTSGLCRLSRGWPPFALLRRVDGSGRSA